ncbi:hypothetical protein DPQ33_02290 [Oceanidesulfovibrio indonesiensis]|uniref:Uncharacterized protein n=1 Tax=Oceanidesulfovibrio indonesiensis TaxID=54767 RepID=A0A7M3MII5_9BACT|nr:hypothetical protein DPQ33_02290 [Oceanidesulfovibrio indonesiensis]
MDVGSKIRKKIKSRVIYHSSTLGIAEVQQMGVASLDSEAFRVQLNPSGAGPGLDLGVAFDRLQSVKAFQKKSYSSTSYLVEVSYVDNSGNLQSITLELRVFFRRGQALQAAKAWKEVFANLSGDAPAEEQPPRQHPEQAAVSEASQPDE